MAGIPVGMRIWGKLISSSVASLKCGGHAAEVRIPRMLGFQFCGVIDVVDKIDSND